MNLNVQLDLRFYSRISFKELNYVHVDTGIVLNDFSTCMNDNIWKDK